MQDFEHGGDIALVVDMKVAGMVLDIGARIKQPNGSLLRLFLERKTEMDVGCAWDLDFPAIGILPLERRWFAKA